MTSISLARAGLTGAGLLLAMWLPGWAAAAGLNDTGVTQCDDGLSPNPACNDTSLPGQDAETGRDAQAGLQKAGGGSAGFDFTKLDSNGNPLDASAMAWDCVRDNVTGLIWEVKTNDGGLRDQGWTYTWYNPDPSTNGGFEGAQDGGSCGSGVGFPEHCNTQAYVAAVNIAGLCGYTTGWRMPTREELRTIVDNSTNNPAITATYFPRTISNAYWSTSPSATDVAGYAWVMHFDGGGDGTRPQGDFYAVRLVRGGQ